MEGTSAGDQTALHMSQLSAAALETSPAQPTQITHPPALQAHKLPVGESVTRGALAMLSTQPLTWAGTLLTTVALPRLMGAEALGQYTIAYTIATLAGTVLGLGVSE